MSLFETISLTFTISHLRRQIKALYEVTETLFHEMDQMSWQLSEKNMQIKRLKQENFSLLEEKNKAFMIIAVLKQKKETHTAEHALHDRLHDGSLHISSEQRQHGVNETSGQDDCAESRNSGFLQKDFSPQKSAFAGHSALHFPYQKNWRVRERKTSLRLMDPEEENFITRLCSCLLQSCRVVRKFCHFLYETVILRAEP